MLVSEVKEKYPLVYERVLEHAEKGIDLSVPTITIRDCFIWVNTKEGQEFWNYIDSQYIDEAKSICPHLFGEDNSPYRVVTNGLFKKIN